MNDKINIDNLRRWIGKTQVQEEMVTGVSAQILSSLLDRRETFNIGSSLPHLYHWLYFLPSSKQSDLSVEGHPVKGDFSPPIPLQRRMWAGGRVYFHKPIHIGNNIIRTSKIKDVYYKNGRSGDLVFVKVEKRITCQSQLLIVEEQDLVYRNFDKSKMNERPERAIEAPIDCDWEQKITPDETYLFRYSALTHNAHRIHYDKDYTVNIEGYESLIVHGPLIATLLVNTIRDNQPTLDLSSLSFKSVNPLFLGHDIGLYGKQNKENKQIKLWAKSLSTNALAMEASVSYK